MAEVSHLTIRAGAFAIQPPRPSTREALTASYGVCRECGEPRRPFATWTLTANGEPLLLHGLACGC